MRWAAVTDEGANGDAGEVLQAFIRGMHGNYRGTAIGQTGDFRKIGQGMRRD